MQNHQKYIPTFDNKKKLTNKFLVVSDTQKILKVMLKQEMRELLKQD